MPLPRQTSSYAPDPTVLTEVYLWLARPHPDADEPQVEQLLMVMVDHLEAGQMLRPLLATDQDAAFTLAETAQRAAYGLGVDAVLRKYRLDPVDLLEIVQEPDDRG